MDKLIARRDFLNRALKTGAGVSITALIANESLAKVPRLVAGAAKRKVTPPITIPYLTSSGNGTCKAFEDVHDDLFARALVLDDGKNSIAVLAVDSIGYDNLILGKGRDFTAELRKRIASKTGLRRDAIMLTATHAHSTPETIGLTNFREVPGVNDWIEGHLQELANTVVDAWKRRVPVRARFGKKLVDGIARNRRILLKNKALSRYGPIPQWNEIAAPWVVDDELSILYLETDDGATHSVLLNYAAHPVVTMLLPKISADYPGAAAAFVEKAFPNSVCLFTQGAAGNINSVHVSSNYEDATDLGGKLGTAAVSEITSGNQNNTLVSFEVQSRSKAILLQPRDCPSLRESEKLAAAQRNPKNARILRLAQKLAEGPLRAEIQTMCLGPVNWISLPGEPFVETGLALKRAGASFVCGYSNGWMGYFPIERAYDEGGYEVDIGAWSRVAPGSAEVLEKSACQLLVER